MEPLIEECYLIYFHADNIHYRELDFALGRILETGNGLLPFYCELGTSERNFQKIQLSRTSCKHKIKEEII